MSEHWLYEPEFYKLSSLGRSAGVVATSAMDQHKQRVGRPYGGTAIVWHSSIKGKVEKIDCDNNRLCAALYTTDNMTMLLVNVYMPCDNNCHDDDFINILNDVSLLFYRYNPSHVVFGGDMNVDLSRTSPNSGMLTDFITDFNLLPCIDLSQSNVPYTFIDRTNNTSRIDHFFISSVLQENIIECSIIDNHLYSDHIAVKLCLQIDMNYIVEIDRPYSVKQAWYKASDADIAHYQLKLDDHLNNMYIDDQLLHCKDINCIRHKRDISMCYSQLIDICSSASDSIPTTSSPSHHSKPGWNDNIKYLRDDALSWHYFWKINSRPGTGYIAEMRRLSRARYHRAVRHLKRAETRMRTEKMV